VAGLPVVQADVLDAGAVDDVAAQGCAVVTVDGAQVAWVEFFGYEGRACGKGVLAAVGCAGRPGTVKGMGAMRKVVPRAADRLVVP
jgi:hypothetical protein